MTKRLYILNDVFDINSNGMYDITFNINNHKISKKYMINKKTYLNIIQENINDNIHTYCEYFKVFKHKDNKIIMSYTKDILDNLEFPPLNKYDFEETYEQTEYNTKYGIIISNKYVCYLELNKEYENNDDISNIF